MKINIGSNKKKRAGFLNLDILDFPGVDIVQDITKPPYFYDGKIISNNSVDELLMEEVLEHVNFRKIGVVLGELYRILKPGGKLHIQVPDIGKMCEYYVNKQICDCVPRKTGSMDDYKADPDCSFCSGRGIIHPERWFFAFSGAQKHPFDNHLSHFTKEKLAEYVEAAGFDVIEFHDNIYKISMDCYKNVEA